MHRIRSAQDQAAYTELYDVYVQRIYRFIYFKVRSKHDAEELTSDVFLGAWTYLCDNTVRSANALFYKMARNKLADFYRTRKEEVDLAAAAATPDETDLEADTELTVAHERVLEALNHIHGEYAQLISMRYLDELDAGEIAQALGKTRNNVRVSLHRAVAALKTQLSIQEHEQRASQPSDEHQG